MPHLRRRLLTTHSTEGLRGCRAAEDPRRLERLLQADPSGSVQTGGAEYYVEYRVVADVSRHVRVGWRSAARRAVGTSSARHAGDIATYLRTCGDYPCRYTRRRSTYTNTRIYDDACMHAQKKQGARSAREKLRAAAPTGRVPYMVRCTHLEVCSTYAL